jgi:DNA-binding beta-propeller fold protein YncE
MKTLAFVALGLLLLDPATAPSQSAPNLGLVADPDWAQLPEGWNFGEAAGVAVDGQQNVYVFHRGPHPLIQFSREGRFLRSLLEGLITSAHTVRIDGEQNIWVVDVGAHTVLKVQPSGRILMVLGRRGSPGADEARFNQPTDVAVAPGGDIYVTDGYGNSRVMKFSRDGKFLTQWGSKGSGPGEFDLPHAVVLDLEGRVYVADRENNRIQVFTPEGQFVAQWPELGSPWGLVMTPEEDILMADGKNNRIIKVGRDGRLLGTYGKPGKRSGEFSLAHGIALGTGGEIFVAEVANWRVQKLVPGR